MRNRQALFSSASALWYAVSVLKIATLLTLACAAMAQTGSRQSTFEGRPSLELSNGALRLTVLVQGASIAGVELLDDPAAINPLWNPARMLRELGQTRGGDGGTGHF